METLSPHFTIRQISESVQICLLTDYQGIRSGTVWLEHYFGAREKARNFLSAKRQQEWLAGRACAKFLLAPMLKMQPQEIIVSNSLDGRPFMAGFPEVAISLSHSHGFAIAAVSLTGKAIGVDVEKLQERRNWRAIEQRFFSSREGASTIKDFYKGWTLKEALWKYSGDTTIALNEMENREGVIYIREIAQPQIGFSMGEEQNGEFLWAVVY
ncbi:MAG: 4'-phosphopantetheinyl transferase superfamily protein [Deltaproteobacteria bacterium]|nr:4'-phosphopantetheinyl transferase superfamily protein [Deltaproteobacteria bacterium]